MRRVLCALLILNGLLLPLACVPVVFVVNMVNPMQFVFIVEFTVENRTENTIYVTPVGTVGAEGSRGPLPMAVWKSRQRRPYGAVPWSGAVRRSCCITTTTTSTFRTGSRSSGRQLRQLVVNPNPTANQYTVPKVTDYVIDDLSQLGAVGPRVRAAYVAAQQPIRWWPILAACLAPAFTFRMLRRWHRRVKASQAARSGEDLATR